jgi:hypothetical protein
MFVYRTLFIKLFIVIFLYLKFSYIHSITHTYARHTDTYIYHINSDSIYTIFLNNSGQLGEVPGVEHLSSLHPQHILLSAMLYPSLLHDSERFYLGRVYRKQEFITNPILHLYIFQQTAEIVSEEEEEKKRNDETWCQCILYQ